jgi:hypothetical protein
MLSHAAHCIPLYLVFLRSIEHVILVCRSCHTVNRMDLQLRRLGRTTPESQSSYSTGSRAGLVDPAVLAQSKMEHEGLELLIATQQGDANTASCCTTWLKPFSETMETETCWNNTNFPSLDCLRFPLLHETGTHLHGLHGNCVSVLSQ